VTLELNRLTRVIEEMGRAAAEQERDRGRWAGQAQEALRLLTDQGAALRDAAAEANAAIPTNEPLDATFPLPAIPPRFTVIGADGTQIQPDRHGLTLYYLINVGSLVYRHGSGQTPEARSTPILRYQDADLYEGSLLVAGNLLDVRRDLAEVTQLADLVEAEADEAGTVPTPTLALVDGTLLLWVLDDLHVERKEEKVQQYQQQLARMRAKGAAVAAFTSRPRSGDVGRLLHLARLGGDAARAKAEPNPLERLPDRAIFAFLPPGARSALFVSPGAANRLYESEHQVRFFYVNVANDREPPVIARVEVPAWVTDDPVTTGLRARPIQWVHSIIVHQSRIVGGFPYVLARADELAYVSGPERQRLEEMVGTALLAAGLTPDLSPKAFYKTLTRQGRRW